MCEQQHLEPVKCSFCRHVFNTEFNYEFYKPKSDRCDKCEETDDSGQASCDPRCSIFYQCIFDIPL